MADKIKKTSMRNTYGDILVRLGAMYKNIVVLDADLAKSTQTIRFGKTYHDRFFDMGISEQDMMSTAAGLAASGMSVFVSTFAMFAAGRPWEQIRNSICYPNLPVKIVATHGGLSVGPDGPTHQACEDLAIMRVLPNMKIIVPADSVETERIIEFLATYYESPVYLRLARMNTPLVFNNDYKFEFGKGIKIKEGKDLTIISTGITLFNVLKSYDILTQIGIFPEVIHMPTIKPIDQQMIIESVKKTGRIITIEEHSIIGGLGGAVAEVLSENYPAYLVRLGIKDMFAESGEPDELFEKYGLSENHIIEAAKNIVKNNIKIK